jgi:hypothetical protein
MSSLVRPVNDVVQTINSSYALLSDGGSILGPVALSTLFSGFSDSTDESNARRKGKGESL